MPKYLFFCIALALMAAGMPRPALADPHMQNSGFSLLQNGSDDDCECCEQFGKNGANTCRSCCAMQVASFAFPAASIGWTDTFDHQPASLLVGTSGSPEPPPPRI